MGAFLVGAAVGDISPKDSQFLYGYPHVQRWSTGIHDPLLCSALYMDDGNTRGILCANDIVGFDKPLIQRIKTGIFQKTGIPAQQIFISATHTHSGPRTVMHDSSGNDPVVPPPDPAYVDFLVDQVIQTACRATQSPVAASVSFSLADATGIGTNRRDPSGPCDLSVPVFIFKQLNEEPIACVCVYSMHPTVLHEDSTLITGDFPSMARQYLQNTVFPPTSQGPVPVLMHMGASGNQSPRHVTRENTFNEAVRIGEILGKAVEKAIVHSEAIEEPTLSFVHTAVNLPKKTFPSVAEAQQKLTAAVNRLEYLRTSNAPSQETRTAECDWFGAEEILTLSSADASGKLDETYVKILPADIMALGIGSYHLVGWPCEIFMEYQLALKASFPNAFPVTLANGELHGYIVTQEAADEGGYEASNTLWGPEAGARILQESIELLKKR
jgi:hypothetical protein